MNCLEFNWIKQNITSSANKLICEKNVTYQQAIDFYIEGVNGIKNKSKNRARFCVNERGLWLMIASVRYNELFRIQLVKQYYILCDLIDL